MNGFFEWLKGLYAVDSLEGLPTEDIDYMRELFGALPRVVEEFYRNAAKTDALHHGQDLWILPEHYRKSGWLRQSDCLILLSENQGVFRAGIRREDLSADDPPVYLTEDDKEWKLCADSTTEFLYAMMAYEAVFSFEYFPEEFYFITEKELAVLVKMLTKLPYEVRGWFGDRILLFSNAADNMVEVMDCGGGDLQMLFGAATEESYLELMDVVEGMGEAI
ncbi:MAG: hypothetical protein K2G32_09915 [Oscillospiraceae bacterium]|nr:hypothetical protein [Oscillospiraceae bacterium]